VVGHPPKALVQGCSALVLLTSWAGSFFVVEAILDRVGVQHYPWVLPKRPQQCLLLSVTTTPVPSHSQMSQGESHPSENIRAVPVLWLHPSFTLFPLPKSPFFALPTCSGLDLPLFSTIYAPKANSSWNQSGHLHHVPQHFLKLSVH
jgi:hypothetical protein